ncbi:hypothetical protein NA56DRAFT_664859 [Hyaloscypha hepaticicola]|uniref:Uncharacterized protein n=1 Tax=Hyaloscypha hepaticicola TaxID=2082293 RepID=A0A2J6PJX6_9HELO|nr:hypothetical protein NA56DRAFT_664859 [Hyaloscypha hepaticicola]
MAPIRSFLNFPSRFQLTILPLQYHNKHPHYNQITLKSQLTMALTREEIEARFRDYVDQGQQFCERVQQHYDAMFGEDTLGPSILIREYAKGLRELDKIYKKTADLLADVASSETIRKEEHQREMKRLQNREEELAAATERARTMKALCQEFSKLSTIVSDSKKTVDKELSKISSDVLTISTKVEDVPTISSTVSAISCKVETIREDQSTKDHLQTQLDSANGTISKLTMERDSLQSQLDHLQGEDGTIDKTSLQAQVDNLTNQLEAKASQPMRPNDYISKKRKFDAGAVEVTIFDDWQALLLKQHETVSLLTPVGDVKDLPTARSLIMRTFEPHPRCFNPLNRYQRAPPRLKTGWRCLATINDAALHLADEIKDDRACTNCRQWGKACVQIKDEGCIWFRVLKE